MVKVSFETIKIDEFDKVKKSTIEDPFVVIHFCCDNNICSSNWMKMQEIEPILNTFEDDIEVKFFNVPICQKSKEINNYLNKNDFLKIIPGTVIFKNKQKVVFNDKSLYGYNEDNVNIPHRKTILYGKRDNINDVILKTYKSTKY